MMSCTSNSIKSAMGWQKEYGEKYNLHQNKGERSALLLLNCKYERHYNWFNQNNLLKHQVLKDHTWKTSGNLCELENPPSLRNRYLGESWFMLRNKAFNQALELGTIYVWGWYPGLGGSNTADLPHPIQSLSQREELLVTSLLVLFSQLSEQMEVIFMSGISFTFPSVTFPHWHDTVKVIYRSYTEKLKAKLKFCLVLIPSNDVTKDDSKNSKSGAPLKKETITFSIWNLHIYETLTDHRCNLKDCFSWSTNGDISIHGF